MHGLVNLDSDALGRMGPKIPPEFRHAHVRGASIRPPQKAVSTLPGDFAGHLPCRVIAVPRKQVIGGDYQLKRLALMGGSRCVGTTGQLLRGYQIEPKGRESSS